MSTRTYRLARNHTHNGLAYVAGEYIALDDTTARWLIEQRVIVGNASDGPAANVPERPRPRAPRCCGWK